MKINILYLYYDILNLYGESGNIKALKYYFESLGIDTHIKFTTLNEEINLKNIDLIYLGMGSENNQLLVLKHLKKYKKEIEKYILNYGFVLSTGNSFELFGKSLDKEKGLGIFEYKSKKEDYRIVDEALYKTPLINKYILGFTNRNSVLISNENNLFEVIKGVGNTPGDTKEGFNKYNFYGTYLVGPILIRNPEFLRYLCNKIIKKKDSNFKIKKVNLKLEENAYQEFMKNYYSDVK